MTKNKQKIPEGWRFEKLGDISIIKKGEQLNKLDMIDHGAYPALNGGINPSGYTDKWNTGGNTIAISEGGNSCGYVNFVKEKFWCGGHCYAIEPYKSIDNLFLYQSLKYRQSDLMRLRVGSGLPNIQRKGLEDFRLLISTPVEQQKIAEILGVVDEDIEKTDEVIKQTEKLKKGLMKELLIKGIGHTKFKKTKLGEIPEDWRVEKISKVTLVVRGGSPRPIQTFLTDREDGLNWLKIGDISSESKYIYQTSEKINKEGIKMTTCVIPGELILSNSMSFGRPYIMRISTCIHDGWLAFKDISLELDTEFLYYILSSEKYQKIFKSLAAGSGVKNLKRESVSEIEIFMPKLNEQKKIVEILSSIDEKISINKEIRDKLLKLKKGLMSDLLSGTVRVNK